MGVRETEVAGKTLVISETEDVCDPATGRALTGSWLWDSAILLSEWLTGLDFDFRGKNRAGGTGLPGLTAALLGASRVVLTDVEPLLGGLTGNVEANGLGDRVEVCELVRGSDEIPSQLSQVGGEDLVVLMSDVFYDASAMGALARTLKRVCQEGTNVWASCEVRPWTGDVLNELVSEEMGVAEFPGELGLEFSSSATSGSSDGFAQTTSSQSSWVSEGADAAATGVGGGAALAGGRGDRDGA
ncbi:hypothetical protein RJ639_024509 [Escallonia herrerae]|uniref:Uncharacterized protein n=1 Tax=Escallonia herrerae TaxID=1293975 RepID=A0AA89ADY4_9ASTE|nr:hypothetical protein RJ639_024509 [Escallonia herrerae]